MNVLSKVAGSSGSGGGDNGCGICWVDMTDE